jgi:hypothetical protein
MALFNNSKHTYFSEFSSVKNMLAQMKVWFIEQDWILLNHETINFETDELVVGSPTGDFCLGFRTYLSATDTTIKSFEIQSFRAYNEERSINNQPLSIPKTNKKCKFLTQPPQSSFGIFSGNKGYIQITRDHVIGNLIDNDGRARSFYAGKFTTYADSDQYQLPLFVGGSTNGQNTVLINDTYCEPENSDTSTSSSYMFGRRIEKTSEISTTYITTDYFLDYEGRWQRCGILSNSIIDEYPQFNANSSPLNFNKSSVLPLNSFMTGFKGNIDNSIKTEKIKIISNKNEATDDDSYIAGELSNLLLLYKNTVNNEDIITINNEDYLCFNDLFRKNSYNNNWCMKII